MGLALLWGISVILVAQFAATFGLASRPLPTEEQEPLAVIGNERSKRIGPGVGLVFAGALLVFLAGRDMMVARAGVTLVHTSCADLEAGQRPSSTWLEVEGNALASVALTAIC